MLLTGMLVMGQGTCRAQSQDILPGLEEDSEEDEAIAFQHRIAATIVTIDGFIQQTGAGKNLSDITLGMFVSKLLGLLGGQDVEVSKHLHAEDRFIEGYLIEVFQYHSDDEVAYFQQLAHHPDTARHRALCLATAAALDVLRNIPDQKAQPLQQAQDRLDLIRSLRTVKRQLDSLTVPSPLP